jgi:hypothetical protein
MSLSLEPPSCRSRSLNVLGCLSLLRADLCLSNTPFAFIVPLNGASVVSVPALSPSKRNH